MDRLRFRRGDLAAAGAVLLCAAGLALVLFLGAKPLEQGVAQIYLDGVLLTELPLDQNRTYQVAGDYHNTVTVQDGRVAVTESDCPGADCVHMGWVSSAGRPLVCLPNRMEVRVTAASDVDIAIG